MTLRKQPLQLRLPQLDRCAPQILAVQLEQVKGAQHGSRATTLPADELKHREPGVVRDDALTVD